MYLLRVMWACLKKDIKSALSERIFTILGVFVPVNFLILMSLFVLAGSNAPTAVVMHDHSKMAQQFYTAMSQAHSFRLQQTSAQEAQRLLQAGQVVAVVTVPADFAMRLERNEPVLVDVLINNLNTDFTDDIRRGIPLAITTFYTHTFPQRVSVTVHETDLHSRDTDYIPYLTVSILVLALMVAGVLQAGVACAREWEKETMKELLLSPASRIAILAGKLLAALLIGLLSVAIVMLVLIAGLGVYPAHWLAVGLVTLLCLVVFMCLGALLGVLLKNRLAVTALGLALCVPLFFVSGAFGPLSLYTRAIQFIARSSPLFYAIALEQYAFHDFRLNSYDLMVNGSLLCLFGLAMFVWTLGVLRRTTAMH